MTRMVLVSIALCLLLMASVAAQDQESEPTLQSVMANIRSVADGYPPKINDPEHRTQIEKQWHWAEEGLLAVVSEQEAPDAGVELLLGDLYRMGYNLDIENCGPKIVERLELAGLLDPRNPNSHHLLGRYYTYSSNYKEGEVELLRAYVLAGPADGVPILFDLTWNSYFQKNFSVTMLLADRFLAINPNDKSIQSIRNFANEAIENGRKPRTIEIEVDGLPDGKIMVDQEPEGPGN